MRCPYKKLSLKHLGHLMQTCDKLFDLEIIKIISFANSNFEKSKIKVLKVFNHQILFCMYWYSLLNTIDLPLVYQNNIYISMLCGLSVPMYMWLAYTLEGSHTLAYYTNTVLGRHFLVIPIHSPITVHGGHTKGR